MQLVPFETYQKYLERSMTLARKEMGYLFHCLTPNCTGWCEFEPGRKTFVCFLCDKTNCLECQVSFGTKKQRIR
jgi:RanBP-type and C3HC4-type zinc finger-containing protein 1